MFVFLTKPLHHPPSVEAVVWQARDGGAIEIQLTINPAQNIRCKPGEATGEWSRHGESQEPGIRQLLSGVCSGPCRSVEPWMDREKKGISIGGSAKAEGVEAG